jgi:hypothetical protein
MAQRVERGSGAPQPPRTDLIRYRLTSNPSGSAACLFVCLQLTLFLSCNGGCSWILKTTKNHGGLLCDAIGAMTGRKVETVLITAPVKIRSHQGVLNRGVSTSGPLSRPELEFSGTTRRLNKMCLETTKQSNSDAALASACESTCFFENCQQPAGACGPTNYLPTVNKWRFLRGGVRRSI